MTGYARGSAEALGWTVSVEVRSLNGRFAEVRIRSADAFAELEPDFRRRVLARVRRGRVDVEVRLAPQGGSGQSTVLDLALARDVVAAARRLRAEAALGIVGEIDVGLVLRMPGVLRTMAQPEEPEPVRGAAERALDEALTGLEAERAREGAALQVDLVDRFGRMRGLVESIRSRAATVPGAVGQRLRERLDALAGEAGIDPARMAQEVALLADRADVTEELVRLDGHLEQAETLLRDPDGDPVGKRLDFLLQEIHRETNTVGSKSPDLELTRLVLDLKSETERVREQVQNLE